MGQFTLTTTTEQDARILEAFTDRFGEQATGPMVKQWLIDQLKYAVKRYELRVAKDAAESTVTDINPT